MYVFALLLVFVISYAGYPIFFSARACSCHAGKSTIRGGSDWSSRLENKTAASAAAAAAVVVFVVLPRIMAIFNVVFH